MGNLNCKRLTCSGGFLCFTIVVINIKLKDREKGADTLSEVESTLEKKTINNEPSPFNNYRTPISDPDFFVGRQKLLKDIGKQPFNVWILLGNRRIGKSSTLQALKWRFLQDQQAFPVFIDLQQRQPESPDHFRYIIAKGLDNDIKEWRKCLHQLRTPESLRKPYQYFSQFCHS